MIKPHPYLCQGLHHALLLSFILAWLSASAEAQPIFSASFVPSTIGPGGISTILWTIDNQGTTPARNVDFSTSLPAGMTLASPANVVTTCGTCVSITAPDGGTSLSFSSERLSGSTACTVSVDVTTSDVGTSTVVTGDLTSSLGNTGTSSAALEVVEDRPVFTKAFSPSTVKSNEISTLTYTIDNTDNLGAVSTLSFTSTLPKGVVIADMPQSSTDCGSASSTVSLSATPGDSVVTLAVSGFNSPGFEALAANSLCTVTVRVQAQGTGTVIAETELLADSTLAKATAKLSISQEPIIFEMQLLHVPTAPNTKVPLRITMLNRASRSIPLTNVGFLIDFDAALVGTVVDSVTVNSCGSSISGIGGGTLTFSGGTISPAGSCTFTVELAVPSNAVVTETSYTIATSTVAADLNGTPIGPQGPYTTELFLSPITLNREVIESSTAPGDPFTLRYTITNQDTVNDATSISFEDRIGVFLGFPLPIGATATTPDPPCGVGSTLTTTSSSIDFQSLQLIGAAVLAGASCSFDVSVTLPATYTEGQYMFPDKVEVSQKLVDMFTYTAVGGDGGTTFSGKGTSDATLVVAKTDALVVNAGDDQVFDCVGGDGTTQVRLGGDNINPGIAGDAMTWTGSFVEGTAFGSNPLVTFTTGVHVVTLQIIDQSGRTESDTVTITVNAQNPPPFANAGADQTIFLANDNAAQNQFISGYFVFLDATGSTGSELTYSWDVTPSAVSDIRVASFTFVTIAPDEFVISKTFLDNNFDNFAVGGKPQFEVFQLNTPYLFTLTVTDRCGLTSADTVSVTFFAEAACSDVNQDPCQNGSVCVAGDPASTYTCTACPLDSGGTNCEGDNFPSAAPSLSVAPSMIPSTAPSLTIPSPDPPSSGGCFAPNLSAIQTFTCCCNAVRNGLRTAFLSFDE